MRKHCSDVCKLRPCLNKEFKNSACLRTIVTAALQRQYSQTELIFWISFVIVVIFILFMKKLHYYYQYQSPCQHPTSMEDKINFRSLNKYCKN